MSCSFVLFDRLENSDCQSRRAPVFDELAQLVEVIPLVSCHASGE
jgi:hypothetical protein